MMFSADAGFNVAAAADMVFASPVSSLGDFWASVSDAMENRTTVIRWRMKRAELDVFDVSSICDAVHHKYGDCF
jgi:hypothetical protein